MRSPQDMQIVLIDITNACTERCSNCTRFCGNHKKPFFMDFETFKRAVDSMEGFPGLVALIGGEPTLHPEFERFCEYLQTRYPRQDRQKRLFYPQKQFIVELLHQEFESHRIAQKPDGRRTFERAGIGIYSNSSGNYHRYHELIQDTFQVQFLNDHINPSFHQPGLFSRKDLGISDKDWFPMRDNCWLQNAWSATITPKGAFFCEIAAAMDMLFDGPGGWPIEPGWWKRQPEDFGKQKCWCEYCGFPLSTFMRPSSDEIDDVSPTMYEKLKEIESPRLKAGRTHLVDIKDGVIDDKDKAFGKRFFATQKYVEHYEDRFSAEKSLLYTDEFDEVFIEDGESFGQELNAFMKTSKDWILFVAKEADSSKARAFVSELMRTSVMNPGTMHVGDEFYLFKSIDRFPLLSSVEVRDGAKEADNASSKNIDLTMYEVRNHRDNELLNRPSTSSYEISIQAGAALTDKRIAKVTDDTGDNISDKNRQYCEMTASYWVWKNTDHAWKGIEHYRRHLLIRPELLSMIKGDVDAILPLPYICYPDELYQFRRFVNEDVKNALLQGLKDVHPDEYEEYLKILQGPYQYTYNMVCAKREVFDDYCRWFFEITEHMEKSSAGKCRNL